MKTLDATTLNYIRQVLKDATYVEVRWMTTKGYNTFSCDANAARPTVLSDPANQPPISAHIGTAAPAFQPPGFKVYEVQAAGFDGDTSDTDDRILWVAAPSASSVMRAVEDTGATFCGTVIAGADDADVDFQLPRDLSRLVLKLHEFRDTPRIYKLVKGDAPDAPHAVGTNVQTTDREGLQQILDGTDWRIVSSVSVKAFETAQEPGRVQVLWELPEEIEHFRDRIQNPGD